MQLIFIALGIVWALPWTVLGIAIGLVGLATGGRMRRIGHTLEFHGGAVRWLLHRLPNNPMAMTLGHTILGLTDAAPRANVGVVVTFY